MCLADIIEQEFCVSACGSYQIDVFCGFLRGDSAVLFGFRKIYMQFLCWIFDERSTQKTVARTK